MGTMMQPTPGYCDWFFLDKFVDECVPKPMPLPGTTPAYVPRTPVEGKYGPTVNPDPQGAWDEYWDAEYAAQASREVQRQAVAAAGGAGAPPPKGPGADFATVALVVAGVAALSMFSGGR